MSMLIRPSRFASGGGSGGDSYFSSVFSLLPMSGTDSSTSFPDQISGRVWTPTGDAEITTAQNPFGASDGSGSFGTGYLTTNTLADWTFLHDGTTSYTIDAWVRPPALGSTRGILGNNKGSSANTGIGIWIDATGHLRVFITKTGTALVDFTSPTVVFSANTWALVTVQFNLSTITMRSFVDGVATNGGLLGSTSTSAPSFALNIGALGGGSLPLDGFASNVRITKAARHPDTGNFTPPTAPWPTSA
jgi:hypothetical protein